MPNFKRDLGGFRREREKRWMKVERTGEKEEPPFWVCDPDLDLSLN